jgi:hypothetical protein
MLPIFKDSNSVLTNVSDLMRGCEHDVNFVKRTACTVLKSFFENIRFWAFCHYKHQTVFGHKNSTSFELIWTENNLTIDTTLKYKAKQDALTSRHQNEATIYIYIQM